MKDSKEPQTDADGFRSPRCYPTPGPWHWKRIECQSDDHTFNSEVIGSDGAEVATQLTEGNARCIAAVVELLEACEMLKQWYQFGGDAPEMLDDCVNAAIKAIDKVEGSPCL